MKGNAQAKCEVICQSAPLMCADQTTVPLLHLRAQYTFLSVD